MFLDNRVYKAFKCVARIGALSASLMSGSAQVLLQQEARLPAGDLSVLDSRTARADLSCQIESVRPDLGFDLRFHTYYRVTVARKMFELAGSALSVILRVRAANEKEPIYFVQRVVLPNLPPETKGMGMFAGGFDVGPGRYEVDWMMRDGVGRVCSAHWELEAKLGSRERNLPLTLARNMIAEGLATPFDDEPASDRVATQGLRVKILLNLSPAGERESLLKPHYANVLASMLRSIVREPDVRRVSLIAFNMRAQKIVYRQDNAETVDFTALGKALATPDAGTVNYRLLQDRRSEAHFVTSLLIDQLGRRTSSEDAIIILGPKVSLEKNASLELLREGGAVSCPIFYLNYNPNPFEDPFPDTIGSALKAYGAASRYEIVRPHDFGAAMREVLIRLGKRPAVETALP
jgi:hypothetical protein